MSRNSVPSFADLLASTRYSAVHLEMRDMYSVADEAEEFEHFKRTGALELDPTARWWPGWLGMVREAVGRGVVMRRARIVSEPVTDYIRWEHASTPLNLGAGELVRWLPRRQAVDIALPGADFWLFDGRIVQFNIFTGDGEWASPPKKFSQDPAVVTLCASAFETVWERAVDHEKYTV
ncbi:hypothetical protein C5L38_00205 [Streptomyces sp. WAC00288]|uniref:DUF6879 family protein n=1 Tax=unclassified Streptomyces TaxID=2593676 RepID=UPI000787692B|nr:MULTISPECIES: DUF6879 family protein [unclassified Streptomyces]AVH93704.1 hypothetical protein C5L38_00205 [Streptomyces sp. WAC00288]KYG51868.1 hypothetical protein AWI43_31465 [Streptomyces sp. WAC04657]